jgi:hypothetical protein
VGENQRDITDGVGDSAEARDSSATRSCRPGGGTDGMLAYMKRTTLKIPESLDAQLRHEAQRRGVTISDVSREALEAYLVGPPGRRRLGAAKAGRSGRSDVSERIEEILAAETRR